jgi:DNA-damage-inducible protein J
MAKTAVIQARIDPTVKEKAQKVLETLHISMSEAISLYLTQVVLHRGIPFEIRIPNRVTLAALQEAEERKNLRVVGSVDELFREIEK